MARNDCLKKDKTTFGIIDAKSIKNVDTAKKSVCNFLVDGGYSGDNFANAVRDIHGADVEVVKRNELHQFKILPMRWIVERSFGWLDKNRRLWKNCERFLHSSLQIIVLAFLALLLRRF